MSSAKKSSGSGATGVAGTGNKAIGNTQHQQKASNDVSKTRTSGATRRQMPSTPPAHPTAHYNTFNAPFFAPTRSPRRQYFIIHPEWASESIGIPEPPATVETSRPACWANTFPPPHTGRRCRSAPPGMHTRSPITWEHWYAGQLHQR